MHGRFTDETVKVDTSHPPTHTHTQMNYKTEVRPRNWEQK